MYYKYLYDDLHLSSPLEVGEVQLTSRISQITYRQKALLVPGFGWVPCSKALCGNFTNDPRHLVLVISEEDDIDKPVTSDIWVARTGLVRSLGIEKGEANHKHADIETNKESNNGIPNVKAYNRMSARALVISENAVLKFLEEPKRDRNGSVIKDKDGQPVHTITFTCGTKKGYVSPAAISIIETGTIDDFQYAEISVDNKTPVPCICRIFHKK